MTHFPLELINFDKILKINKPSNDAVKIKYIYMNIYDFTLKLPHLAEIEIPFSFFLKIDKSF